MHLTKCLNHDTKVSFAKLLNLSKSFFIDAKLTNMEKLEHIGIAVKNLELSISLFSEMLGQSHYKIDTVDTEGVMISFFNIGDIKIELMDATLPDSPIAKFVAKKGECIHHLTFSVSDIGKSIDHYKQQGFEVINEIPKRGADDKIICFLHPKSTGGVLIELCQDV